MNLYKSIQKKIYNQLVEQMGDVENDLRHYGHNPIIRRQLEIELEGIYWAIMNYNDIKNAA